MRKFILSLAAVFFFFSSWSQKTIPKITPTVINSTGGSFKLFDMHSKDNSFYLDWSVGEMTLVNTMRSTEEKKNYIIITNGFLQPDNGPDQGNEDRKTDYFTSSEIKVYPNPAVDYIEVNFLLAQTGNAKLVLYNSIGQPVFTKQFAMGGKTRTEHISMNGFTQGTYMLYVVVSSDGNTVKQGSFKIIKTN